MKILNSTGDEIARLDLGTLQAGESKTFKYYLFNNTLADVTEIELAVPNPEVIVENYPTDLGPNEKASFELTWTPSIDVKKALQTLIKIKAKETYRPR